MNDWTERECQKLTELWNLNLTAAQIAAVMGKSRNAVLGKRNRLGLAERGSPIVKQAISEAERQRRFRLKQQRAAQKSQRRLEARAEQIKRAQERERKRREKAAMMQLAFALVNPDAAPVPFAELAGRPNLCRYPVNSGWCGRDTHGAGSWCPHHRTIVFIKRTSPDEQQNAIPAPAVAAE